MNCSRGRIRGRRNSDVAGSAILIIRDGFSPTIDYTDGGDIANAIDLQNNVTLKLDTGSELCPIIKSTGFAGSRR